MIFSLLTGRVVVLGYRRNVLVRMAGLGTCDVLRCIDLSPFRRHIIESVDVASDGHSTGHLLSDLLLEFLADLFHVLFVVALCFPSLVEFNPHDTVFSITDRLISDSVHLFTSFPLPSRRHSIALYIFSSLSKTSCILEAAPRPVV